MIVYNGKRLSDFGVMTDRSQFFNRPELDYEEVEVPGVNGSLRISKDRYKNVKIPVNCCIDRDFVKRYTALSNFLLQDGEYHRLENDAEPDRYMMASASLDDPDPGQYLRGGMFTIQFNAKPERWLKSGEEQKTLTASAKIYNPTRQKAKPLIRVYGSGELAVASQSMTVTNSGVDYVDIDCRLQDCYCRTTNCNNMVVFSSNNFPVFAPGDNGITIGSGITKVIITPRWYEI